MKKMSLQTFKSMAVQCTVSSSKKKTVEVKAARNLLGSLLILSQHHKVNLDRLFLHPVGPIPWAPACIFTAFVILSVSISNWQSLYTELCTALHLNTCLTFFAALLTCRLVVVYGRRLAANLMSARRVS